MQALKNTAKANKFQFGLICVRFRLSFVVIIHIFFSVRERYGDGTGVESGQEYDKELEKKRLGDYGNDTGSEQIRNGSGLEARVRKEYEGGLGSNDLLISTGEEGSGHQEPLRVIEISGGQDSMKIGE